MSEIDPVYIFYRGHEFEIMEDSWATFDTGDEYEIKLSYQCRTRDIQLDCFEKSRDEALAAACGELYELVVTHQSRCSNCQSDVVERLLRRERLPKKENDEDLE